MRPLALLLAATLSLAAEQVKTTRARLEPPPVAQASDTSLTNSIDRSAIETLEKATDRKFEQTMDEDPFALLGFTRAIVLDNYGVAFTAEVDLAPSAAPNPFRPAYGRGERQLLNEKKKYRVIQLKESMRQMLRTYAAALEPLSSNDNITLGVTIPYFSWEDTAGLPRRIIMTAPKKTALELKENSPADSAGVKVQEIY